MATIKINGIESLGAVENFTVTPDDRQTLVQVLDGAVVQDMGYFDEGMKFAFSVTFTSEDFAKVIALWKERARITFTDSAGVEWQDCRLVLKTWQYLDHFERRACKASCEIWRV